MEEETHIPAPSRQKMTAFNFCRLGPVPGGLTEEFIMIIFTGKIVVLTRVLPKWDHCDQGKGIGNLLTRFHQFDSVGVTIEVAMSAHELASTY